MKRGLVKAFAGNDIAKLCRFPAVLDPIVGGIHQKRVTMPVGINLAANRPGRAMDETGKDRVAGGTILLCVVYPYPGLNRGLHIVQSFSERLVNQLFDPAMSSKRRPRQGFGRRLNADSCSITKRSMRPKRPSLGASTGKQKTRPNSKALRSKQTGRVN